MHQDCILLVIILCRCEMIVLRVGVGVVASSSALKPNPANGILICALCLQPLKHAILDPYSVFKGWPFKGTDSDALRT